MSEYKFHWQDTHVKNLDKAKETADEFFWNISVVKHGEMWFVFAGDKALISSDDKNVIDAFLYGLALSYTVIPEPYYSQLKKNLNDEFGIL